MDNCISAAGNLLTELKVRHTKGYLEESIMAYPNHPSLLCISDTLERYSVRCLAVRVNEDRLWGLPLPCIVQFSDKGGMFHVLTAFSDNAAGYLDGKGSPVNISKEVFMKKWTGICLLAETTETTSEPGIKGKLSEIRTMVLLKWAVALLFTAWAITHMADSWIFGSTPNFLGLGYLGLKLIGLAAGLMLLLFEVDRFNPTLQSFCTGGKKINCDIVLGSKYAKLFNGQLSLGLLGFAYFFGTLSFLVIQRVSAPSLTLSSYLSLVTVPVIFASIYYQAVIIKQGCRFCIVVQAVLVLEVLIVLAGGFYGGSFRFVDLSILLAMSLLPILVWKWLKPILEVRKEANLHKRRLKKIKGNPDVLHGLLSMTRRITTSTAGLGISFTNDRARYNVIKVCNPYCGPCAKAHPILEELLEKERINLQVLFTVSSHEDNKVARTVGHFMAIDCKGNKKRTKKALDDWYLSTKKDYENFSKKHPMNGELEEQRKKIEAMRQWCDAERITHTPTIFINGHELPKEYSIEDLKEVLG